MKQSRGFSLVEVMIASAILGIGVLATVNLFGHSTQGVSWTRDRSAATTIAIERLEFLGTKGIASLPACNGAIGCQSGPTTFAAVIPGCTQQVGEMQANPAITDPSGKYRVDTVVKDHPDLGRQGGAKLVTVSVCWRDRKQLVHQAQLERLFVPDL